MRKYMPRKGVKMTDAALHLEMGKRLAWWLRKRYPEDGPKRLARETGASPHTTRRWFEGALPENKHFAVLARMFGKQFVALVMEPAVGPWPSYAMMDEIEAMESRLAQMRADLEAEDARGSAAIEAHRVATARQVATDAAVGGRVVPADAAQADPVEARPHAVAVPAARSGR